MYLLMTHHVSLLLCYACRSGMEVVKIGGPVYRIGVGGGAASSVQVRPLNHTETSSEPNLCRTVTVFEYISGCRSRGTTPATGIWVQCREEMLRWSRK